jgi:hypothetical protein
MLECFSLSCPSYLGRGNQKEKVEEIDSFFFFLKLEERDSQIFRKWEKKGKVDIGH